MSPCKNSREHLGLWYRPVSGHPRDWAPGPVFSKVWGFLRCQPGRANCLAFESHEAERSSCYCYFLPITNSVILKLILPVLTISLWGGLRAAPVPAGLAAGLSPPGLLLQVSRSASQSPYKGQRACLCCTLCDPRLRGSRPVNGRQEMVYPEQDPFFCGRDGGL